MRLCLVFYIKLYYLIVINAASSDGGYCDKSASNECTQQSYVSHFDSKHTDKAGLDNQHSSESEVFESADVADPEIFIFYDVNPGEGFNLRRDVYIRMVIFLNILRQYDGYRNAKLVLPPFYRLYHWQSRDQTNEIVFWNHFFDMDKLKSYSDVIDVWEYFEIMKTARLDKSTTQYIKYKIDYAIQLKHFASMFESGKFEDKYEFGRCTDAKRKQNEKFHNIYSNFSILSFHCVEYQGSASLLYNVLEELPQLSSKGYSIAILNAETVLHDHWGDREFWRARMSMHFNNELVHIASEFQQLTYNYSPETINKSEEEFLPDGGNYICAHLRRADFIIGREKTTPSLKSAAEQIKIALQKFNLRDIFISSDCSGTEFKELKSNLKRYRVSRFSPVSQNQRLKLKDGGIAVIDQIICSYARYFIGTYESTFTYRIYEEREILGFPQENTFNTFCKFSDDVSCSRNPTWPIVY